MDQKQSFEANIKELEGVVRALEGNETSLDEMLTLFERGIHLTQACTAALEHAQQKITVLMQNRENGTMEEQPFAGLGE